MTLQTTERHPHLFLLRVSGDVSTKAVGTKQRFVRRLARNVADGLRSAGLEHHLTVNRHRIVVEVESLAAADVFRRVFGIQSYSAVHRRSWEKLDDLVSEGRALFGEVVRDRRFAVRAKRGGDTSRIPFRSLDVEQELGRALLPFASKVDLDHPEVTAQVEVQPGRAFFFDRKLKAPGGLPLGVEGNAVALVSGGFDSAVASWLLLKRGVGLHYLFCNLGGEAHRRGVLQVLKVLADQWSYGTRPRLFEVDFTPVVAALREKTAPRYRQILLKRLMIRAGVDLARYLKAPGLVTGEAVGQVSSQTLQNLAVIGAGTDFPIHRPLVGFNKEEIIALAREIGTYGFSSGVEEYCAITTAHPATHATLNAVLAEEKHLDLAGLEAGFRERRVVSLRGLELPSDHDLETETVEEGAVVLDLRSPAAYRGWHYPGALNLEFMEALKVYRALDRGVSYVLYCEVGQKSAHLAELMNREGFRAKHLKQGLRGILRRLPEPDLLGL